MNHQCIDRVSVRCPRPWHETPVERIRHPQRERASHHKRAQILIVGQFEHRATRRFYQDAQRAVYIVAGKSRQVSCHRYQGIVDWNEGALSALVRNVIE